MQNVIKIEDRLYEVIRTVPAWQVGENTEGLKEWVEYLYCDKSFKMVTSHPDGRQEEKYVVVRSVEDIESIEDPKN